MLERQAVTERGLADEQRGACIVVTGCDFSERRERGRVGRLVGELGSHDGCEIAFVERVKQLEGARDFEAMIFRGHFRRTAERHHIDAEACARKLAVIGGRELRGSVIKAARILRAAQRLGGAALPVIAARQRDRVDDAFADPGEMAERERRVAQKAQRDPAGGELLLGAIVLVVRRRGSVGDLIGEFAVAEIEQFARKQPPLDPPLIDVAELSASAARPSSTGRPR